LGLDIGLVSFFYVTSIGSPGAVQGMSYRGREWESRESHGIRGNTDGMAANVRMVNTSSKYSECDSTNIHSAI